MSARKTTVELARHDDVQGGIVRVICRAWQDVTKSGRDAKRSPRIRGKMLVIYPDGSKRFYDNARTLRFEKVSKERADAELRHSIFRHSVGA